MPGSSYGEIFKVTTWGESHGKALGAVIDGCPAGIPITEEHIQKFMDRRKPGASRYATKRAEADKIEIYSGVFESLTTGCPIMMAVKNEDHISANYDNIKSVYRPAHADYGFSKKFGIRDYRGGGRSSGRETLCRVAAGAVAVKALEQLGIKILTYTKSIGGIFVSEENFDEAQINKNELYMPDDNAYKKATSYLDGVISRGDSAGGIIECVIKGVKPGIGQPVFDKLDACISHAVFSIGAVKGVEFGAGMASASMNASKFNDGFYADEDKNIRKRTNNSGGITGGLSDGADIVFRAAVKPTPSISLAQQTADTLSNNVTVNITGRHDPVIVPRAVVVVEAMAAIALLDMILISLPSKAENLKRAYENL
ncbi:MAG: chorismate synthase [Clostridiales bacterium]|nr:chorismate synthase [Clostridiales bacterium]